MSFVLTVEDIIVEPPGEGQIVDPMSWFDSPGPFELEIGCGKGGFLLHRATAHPHLRLLGIEWANKYFRYCADRMARRGVINVRVMRTNAAAFVMHHLPPECISVLHLYHPDPWPKKRHHKRRLVQQGFVDAAARSLVHGGRWLVQTDHAEYFEQIKTLLGGQAELRPLDPQQVADLTGAEWAGTNFEIKYTREGRAIYRAAYRRAD
jgi:tRNA (guanine-N7-)-methyltransferase